MCTYVRLALGSALLSAAAMAPPMRAVLPMNTQLATDTLAPPMAFKAPPLPLDSPKSATLFPTNHDEAMEDDVSLVARIARPAHTMTLQTDGRPHRAHSRTGTACRGSIALE